ncbi:hypothetical protein CERZMDRAFT_89783 [Cercospora zeae-maydis SCOH1-5]|uniref:Uncharacterized protein n=1 Tax=Cercospora zeae-maydis SCOH1-5 TaxID=717836 RepID=A0A6A6FUJ6_9PEZI|nr:hypothetical protein CERZMDRAFT_89783 [Cercospora zeae-maydis SCOH1-5]
MAAFHALVKSDRLRCCLHSASSCSPSFHFVPIGLGSQCAAKVFGNGHWHVDLPAIHMLAAIHSNKLCDHRESHVGISFPTLQPLS